MWIRNSDPHPVPTVPANAPTASLELDEPITVATGDISVCKLKLKDKTTKPKTDVMIWSNGNSDIVVGWTLSTVDEDYCVFASVLNTSRSTLVLKKGQALAQCASVVTEF